jgi:hypothetical protein
VTVVSQASHAGRNSGCRRLREIEYRPAPDVYLETLRRLDASLGRFVTALAWVYTAGAYYFTHVGASLGIHAAPPG